MPEPSPPPVPPPGAALLEQLLTALTGRVTGALGAAVAVPAAAPDRPHVLAAVGAGAPSPTAALATVLRGGEPVLTALPGAGGGVVAVAAGPEPGPAVALAVVLNRAPEPPDADSAAADLPALAAAVAVLQAWAAETALAGQMVQMVQYRGVIEQAKGLVMALTGSDAPAAFATLARASQHFNVRLRNLAVALVELVGGAPAEGPDDPAAVVVPAERDRRAALRMWAALSADASAGPGRRGPGEG